MLQQSAKVCHKHRA